jgi:hypothetical protein
MGRYGAGHGNQALVDVQCLWLMLGGVRVGNSQRTSVALFVGVGGRYDRCAQSGELLGEDVHKVPKEDVVQD